MKYRESEMPIEELWQSFFNPVDILKQMGVDKNIRILIDIGCGYGTFLLPATELVSGNVIGIDVDEKMIEVCGNKIQDTSISNVHLINGDISKEDTIEQLKKYKAEIDYITLFNIIHCEKPLDLLQSVYDVLNKNGKIGVIHWKYEETPRGPSMEIRPKPETIIEWASKVGFTLKNQIDLPPYHFGLVFVK
ncbi:class I SAM-dependent methyltransferase [Clostridium pasteurianum]|uniref:Methylase involved in ubiquinone/menaquinone biosynthesis n=1 Tax=Clostridium pasteurianum BC1 TaxID=86416 RepID=R4KAQ9_CLOPA|nr:methyltransferase domain-containing protein [Clostridium pasteurianum]AGK96725.1 methylase involved in ubiquinone/menaquinone biosynthesis [Clostridium pasteurianum BC1]